MTFQIEPWAKKLEGHFLSVYQNSMKDLPVVNPNIQVELAVLNEIKPNMYLGAVVTPWFINLMFKIVDEQGEDRHHDIYTASVGEHITLKFPSGAYEFIVNHQPELGYFYTCALISDMHSIENHNMAIELATQSVQLVFNEEAYAETTRQKDIKAISMGVAKIAPNTNNNTKVVPVKSLDEKINDPVSRRALFGLPKQTKNTPPLP